jgi:hypothetical protein
MIEHWRAAGHPASYIDIIGLFLVFLFLPTFLPTDEREKDREIFRSFLFRFLKSVNWVRCPTHPLWGRGGKRVVARFSFGTVCGTGSLEP